MNLKIIGKYVTTWWGMWLVFFIYTAALAVFLQQVFVPHFFSAHSANGLISPDSHGFNTVAQEQTKAMMKYGWKAWQLFPRHCYPSGIASIFYYLWCPEPFTVIPFNAALHATAGCLVFFILSFFIKDRIAAFGGAALFVFNPASLEWTAQLHRDGTFILGNLLVLVSWLLISKSIKQESWKPLIYSAVAFFAGTLAIWVSRPYWIQVVVVPCAILSVVTFICMITAWYRSRSIGWTHIASFLLVCIMLVTLIPISKMERDTGVLFMEDYQVEKAQGVGTVERIMRAWGGFQVKIMIRGPFKWIAAMRNHTYGSVPIEGQYRGIFLPSRIEWRFLSLIPAFIDLKLYSVAVYRLETTWVGGESLVDPEVQLMSATDYLSYLPRALEVGFLSPFPSMWFAPGGTGRATVGRSMLGPVTMLSYICLAFFIWGSRKYLKDPDFRLIVLFSIYGLLVFTYTYPNIGVLNRFRYTFYMTIVSIGFAFMVQKIIMLRSKRIRKDEQK